MSLSLKCLLFLALLNGIWSCQKNAEFRQKGENLQISLEEAEIEDAEEIKWRSGLIGNNVISKGFFVKLKLPILDKDLIKKIAKKYKADAWMIRVRQRTLMKNEVIGQLNVPIILPGTKSSFKSRMRPLKSVTFYVYYAAAATSSHLENLQCPAFGHRYRIGDIDFEENEQKHWITLAPYRRQSVLSKLKRFSYNPVKLNAGSSLTGTFEIELGLLDSENKIIVSSMRSVSDRVVIEDEEKVELPKCEGFEIPSPKGPDEEDTIERFKFGR